MQPTCLGLQPKLRASRVDHRGHQKSPTSFHSSVHGDQRGGGDACARTYSEEVWAQRQAGGRGFEPRTAQVVVPGGTETQQVPKSRPSLDASSSQRRVVGCKSGGPAEEG